MKTLLLSAVAIAAVTAPAGVSAQRLSPTVVAVVDAARVTRDCTACRAAQTQLEAQLASARTRATQLRSTLQTRGAPIQTAITALAGRQPDAALATRIRAFQTEEETANRELAQREQQLRSIQANVNRQIGERLLPIINTVMTARGATVAIDRGATLASAQSIDVTADVLAQLNAALPSVSVTPLPAAAAPATPQGR